MDEVGGRLGFSIRCLNGRELVAPGIDMEGNATLHRTDGERDGEDLERDRDLASRAMVRATRRGARVRGVPSASSSSSASCRLKL